MVFECVGRYLFHRFGNPDLSDSFAVDERPYSDYRSARTNLVFCLAGVRANGNQDTVNIELAMIPIERIFEERSALKSASIDRLNSRRERYRFEIFPTFKRLIANADYRIIHIVDGNDFRNINIAALLGADIYDGRFGFFIDDINNVFKIGAYDWLLRLFGGKNRHSYPKGSYA